MPHTLPHSFSNESKIWFAHFACLWYFAWFWFEGASLFTDEQKKNALDFLIACAIISTRPTSSSVDFYCGKYVKFRHTILVWYLLLSLSFPLIRMIGINKRRTHSETETMLEPFLAYARRISFKLTPSSFNFSDFFHWTFFLWYYACNRFSVSFKRTFSFRSFIFRIHNISWFA